MAETQIAVIGAGTMGRGIAQAAVQAGYRVVLLDQDPDIVRQAVESIQGQLKKLEEKGVLDPGRAGPLGESLVPATSLDQVAGSAFVLEAIVEDAAEKSRLFEQLSAILGDSGVLASNTSSIPITELAAATRYPENVIGMHFMNPVPLMPGVEIIRGLRTSPETLRKTLHLAEGLAKKPVYSSDRAGFVINRILMPLINEAITVVGEGTSSIEDVDQGAVVCLNHPLGPLALSDLIGNDTTRHILTVLEQEQGERFKPAPLLTRLVQAGFLGRKTGTGFYLWEGHKPKTVNPAVAGYLPAR